MELFIQKIESFHIIYFILPERQLQTTKEIKVRHRSWHYRCLRWGKYDFTLSILVDQIEIFSKNSLWFHEFINLNCWIYNFCYDFLFDMFYDITQYLPNISGQWVLWAEKQLPSWVIVNFSTCTFTSYVKKISGR